MLLPNYLTFVRVLISPIFLVIYLEREWLGISLVALPYLLIFLLAISELTDAFDGYVARKFNQVTDFGKVLDPMADSLARITVFLAFTQPPINLPLILVFIFLYRDSVISYLRMVCALRGFALAARTSGKIKAIVQAVAAFLILFLLIPYTLGKMEQETLYRTSLIITLLAAIYTLFSGVDYIYANREYVKKIFKA